MIKVTKALQRILFQIIDDYLIGNQNEENTCSQPTISSEDVNYTATTEPNPNDIQEKPAVAPRATLIPEYVRDLFRHYCLSQKNPDVDDMKKHSHKIYKEMDRFPKLRRHFFHEDELDCDYAPEIDVDKIKKLFPNNNIPAPSFEMKPISRQSTWSNIKASTRSIVIPILHPSPPTPASPTWQLDELATPTY